MMETDTVSQTCFFVFPEYQMTNNVQKPQNPEYYKVVSSPCVKLGTIIKTTVCHTAKKQSHH
jgi:hypothetical protein